MKFKGIMAVLLIAAMSLSLCGCSSKLDEAREKAEAISEAIKNDKENKGNSSGEESSQNASGQDSQSSENEGTSGSSSSGSSTSGSSQSSSSISVGDIEETVLVDQDDIKVTAKSLTITDWDEISIDVLIENNTDKDLSFSVFDFYVNGYCFYGTLYQDVTAGKKANTSIYCWTYDLEDALITKIGSVSIAIQAYDSNTYDTYIVTEPVEIRTTLYDQMDGATRDFGAVFWNAQGVYISGTCFDYGIENFGITFYIENNTDQRLDIIADSFAINGYSQPEYFCTTLLPGTKTVAHQRFGGSTFEQQQISVIGSYEFTITACDNFDWYSILFVSDPILVETENVASMDGPDRSYGTKLIDNGDFYVSYELVDYVNEYGGRVAEARLYVENNSSSDVTLCLDDLSVNGFMIYSWISNSTLSAGKKAICVIYLDDTELTDNGIESLEEVEFNLTAHDSGSWSNLLMDEDLKLTN